MSRPIFFRKRQSLLHGIDEHVDERGGEEDGKDNEEKNAPFTNESTAETLMHSGPFTNGDVGRREDETLLVPSPGSKGSTTPLATSTLISAVIDGEKIEEAFLQFIMHQDAERQILTLSSSSASSSSSSSGKNFVKKSNKQQNANEVKGSFSKSQLDSSSSVFKKICHKKWKRNLARQQNEVTKKHTDAKPVSTMIDPSSAASSCFMLKTDRSALNIRCFDSPGDDGHNKSDLSSAESNITFAKRQKHQDRSMFQKKNTKASMLFKHFDGSLGKRKSSRSNCHKEG